MNDNVLLRLIRSMVITAALLGPVSAHAIFRAYLSSTGSDANPCSVAAPCRLLPAALSVVDPAGEIWMLDSANFNTSQVTITKSVTILAVPGAVGSIVATGGGSGLVVNAASVRVTLRNLVIIHLAGSTSVDGIRFQQGTNLLVEECEIANVGGSGINVTATGSATQVKNTVIRGTHDGVYANGSVFVALSRVRIIAVANAGVVAYNSSRVTVADSLLTGSPIGAIAYTAGGTARLDVYRSVLTENNFGILGQTTLNADAVRIVASRNEVSHNATGGITASAANQTNLYVVLEGNKVTDNAIGLYNTNNGGTVTFWTRGNNTVKDNSTDVSGSGITALAGQ
jgi:hypothetical protein